MKLKDEIYDDGCPTCGCGKKLTKPAVYGCDQCKTEISSPYDEQRDYLEITVFYSNDRGTVHFQFCCWSCVFTFLKTIQQTEYKCDYFISLPQITFDGSNPEYNDFICSLTNSKEKPNENQENK